MKRLLLIVTLSLSLPIISFASHNLGGYISYKHLSGLTYEITVTTFTEASTNTADRCELIVDFGDGTSESVERVNGIACSGNPACAHCGEIVANEYKLNEYVITHTFPTNNRYTITMEDPNRTAGIINMVNSVNTVFSISSEIEVSQGVPNISLKILESPNLNVSMLDTVKVNLSAFDEDGDILTYELVTPMVSNSQLVPGYFLPNSVSIDPNNGEFKWDSPAFVGDYVFAVKISECRNGSSLGFTIMEFTITISQAPSEGEFLNIHTWQKDYFGRFIVNVSPNDTVNFNVEYQDLIVSATKDIKGYGEVFENGNNASFTYLNSNNTDVAYNLNWVPTNQHSRCMPYVLTFRGKSNYSNFSFSKDITVMVFVKDQSTLNCSTVCGGVLSIDNKSNENAVSVSISPNPINSESVIQIKSDNSNQDYSFVVYNMLGKRVRVIQLQNQSEFTFHKENLPSGLYIYELSNGVSVLDKGKLVLVD
jgi:hypothetical protein